MSSINMENIPSHILDLLNQKTFGQLNPQERTEVLQYLNETEYIALHDAALASHSLAFNEQSIKANSKQKELLMQLFRQKNKKVLFLNTPIELWKVAASFLMFGIACYYFYMQTPNRNLQYLTQTDTVYLENKIPAEMIFDTIYLGLEQNNVVSKNKAKKTGTSKPDPVSVEQYDLIDVNALNQLSIKDYDDIKNDRKGTNIKDDSLIKAIGFAHL